MKLDIRKAFDTLRWEFIKAVLLSFGFDVSFVKWVDNILHSARLSILINGTPHGYFPCSRGVRQGDPLSPLLFVLAEDYLSRYFIQQIERGAIIPMTSTRKERAPFHYLFADDVLLFARA